MSAEDKYKFPVALTYPVMGEPPKLNAALSSVNALAPKPSANLDGVVVRHIVYHHHLVGKITSLSLYCPSVNARSAASLRVSYKYIDN